MNEEIYHFFNNSGRESQRTDDASKVGWILCSV